LHGILGRQRQPPAPQAAITLREDETPNPTGKCLGITELIEAFPGHPKGVLGGIFREGGIAQPGVRARERQILKSAYELSERLVPVDDRRRRVARPANY
jgi:hypothetical protein